MYKHHAIMHLIATKSLNNTSVHKHTSNLFNSIWVWTQCEQCKRMPSVYGIHSEQILY